MKFLLLASLLMLSSCDALFQEECTKLKPRWENYPVTYSIDNSVPEKFRPTIINAAKHWNERFGKLILTHFPQSTNKVYWITSGWENKLKFTEKSIAVTSGYSSSGYFTDFMIRVNAEKYSFYNNFRDEERGYMHLETVMIHEFGHAIGLDHTTWGVMKPGIPSNTEITNLSNLKCSL